MEFENEKTGKRENESGGAVAVFDAFGAIRELGELAAVQIQVEDPGNPGRILWQVVLSVATVCD